MLELCATSLFGLSVISPLVNLPNWTRVETVFVSGWNNAHHASHCHLLNNLEWWIELSTVSCQDRNQTQPFRADTQSDVHSCSHLHIDEPKQALVFWQKCRPVIAPVFVFVVVCMFCIFAAHYFLFSTSAVYKHIRPHLVFLPLIWFFLLLIWFFLLLIWSNSPLAFPVSSPLGWRTTSPVTMQYRHVTRPNATHVIIKYRARHNESSTVTHRALSAKLQTRVAHKTPTGFAENEGAANYFALKSYINSIYSI